jgi:hypothetical protein
MTANPRETVIERYRFTETRPEGVKADMNRTAILDVVRLDWPDGGTLYDVHHVDGDTSRCLTDDESLPAIPDTDALFDLVLLAEERGLLLTQFHVTYQIRSLQDPGAGGHVGDGEVVVTALDEDMARTIAATWVREHDYRHDDRIDPVIEVTDVEPISFGAGGFDHEKLPTAA